MEADVRARLDSGRLARRGPRTYSSKGGLCSRLVAMSLTPRLRWSPEPLVSCDAQQIAALERIGKRLRDGTYELETTPCFCGRPGGIKIADRDRWGFPVRTLLCTVCGLLRASPRMTPASAARFHAEDRAALDGTRDHRALHVGDLERGRVLAASFEKAAPGIATVFHVGCGSGGLLAGFAEAGKAVFGADRRSSGISEGIDRGLSLMTGGVDELRQASGTKADLVLIGRERMRSEDPLQVIRDAIGAMNPGGLLQIDVEGLQTAKSEHGGDLLKYFQLGQAYCYTTRTLEYVVCHTGVSIVAAGGESIVIAQLPVALEPPGEELSPDGHEASRVLRTLFEFEDLLETKAAAA